IISLLRLYLRAEALLCLFPSLLLPVCSKLFPYTTLFRSPCPRRWTSPRSSRRPASSSLLLCSGHDLHREHKDPVQRGRVFLRDRDRKSTRLNSSHVKISYAVFCMKKKTRI